MARHSTGAEDTAVAKMDMTLPSGGWQSGQMSERCEIVLESLEKFFLIMFKYAV